MDPDFDDRAPLARAQENLDSSDAMVPVGPIGIREILMSSVPCKENLSIANIDGLFSGRIPLRKSNILSWPSSAPHLQCLHCGGQCSFGPPVPAARIYESQNDQYWLYGPFCRPCCSLGYICESDSTSKQLAPTIELLRRYFNSEKILVAPPRASHRRFGGPLNDQDFYGTSGYVAMQTVQPPFVTFANYVVGFHQQDQMDDLKDHTDLKDQKEKPKKLNLELLLPQSAGKLAQLVRPSFRKDPVAERQITGKEPLFLEFLANLKNIKNVKDSQQEVEIKQSKKRRNEIETEVPKFLQKYVVKKSEL